MSEAVSTPIRANTIGHSAACSAGAPGLPLPAWVREVVRRGSVERSGGVRAVSVTDAGAAALVTGVIPRARSRAADELRAEVSALYGILRSRLAATPAPHPVRIWNWIPGIHAPLGPGLSRYCVFNSGRFDAFCSWFGDPGTFHGALPTATGVGHDGDDLTVHMLGAASCGRAIENPRQRPAWRYSRRYGPRPPCFARATVATIGGAPRLLIGGTASVRGEDSVHTGSLEKQVGESLENIEAIVRVVAGASLGLEAIRQARVYFPRAGDEETLRAMVGRGLESAERIEMVRAEPCRDDLLVEIEAIADLPGCSP